MTLRLGWFTAGRGPGSRGMFQHVLHAIAGGTLDARIEFVFMHRERGEGDGSDAFMDLAASHGIPVVALSSRRFATERGGPLSLHREAFDAKAIELLAPYRPDLCVLAGYLLIMSPAMTRAFIHVNLHPALPDGPIGLWHEVIWWLIEQRAAEGGAFMFKVTDELDRGPAISYTRYALRGPELDPPWRDAHGTPIADLRARGEEQPLFAVIRREGLRREPLLVTATLRLFAGGELRVRDGRVVDEAGNPATARDLTSDIEAALARKASATPACYSG
ncbi:MAG: hypothetical protein FJ318_08310 [SAR202 cluster bacterium]|nr:hypothetical protein [SAR202 cluster bacterium]